MESSRSRSINLFFPTQDNEVSIGATLTPFLPEPAQIPFVNDDAAIQAALAEKLERLR